MVVSLQISGRKFKEIYSNLSENFWEFVKEFFSFYILIIIMCFQVQHCKVML